jgi:hypothetical protein
MEKFELKEKKLVPAEVATTDVGDRRSCGIYSPAPNNETEPPHVYLRANNTLELNEKPKASALVMVTGKAERT